MTWAIGYMADESLSDQSEDGRSFRHTSTILGSKSHSIRSGSAMKSCAAGFDSLGGIFDFATGAVFFGLRKGGSDLSVNFARHVHVSFYSKLGLL